MRFISQFLIVAIVLLAGCSSTPPPDVKQSSLTSGMVKKTIEKGKTSQADILEVFGAPDMVTHRDGIEIWTYDKTRYDVTSTSGYLTVILAGTSSSQRTSSSTSTMLILYFKNDIVQDYRLNSVKF